MYKYGMIGGSHILLPKI